MSGRRAFVIGRLRTQERKIVSSKETYEMTKESEQDTDCKQCRLNAEVAQSLWAISIVAKSLAERVTAMNAQLRSGGERDAP